MPFLLSDLDELVLKCRDRRARTYIAEAVASYKVGACRAAIVSTWIAVCYDFIDKLRELALSGDKEAEKHVEDLEKTRKAGDVAKALSFERELLTLARDKFELISQLEYIDLERLQADRNRCAHPSLASDDQAYAPSAELARAHIHAAINHSLQHAPAQGKYALDRLIKEIHSEYFPTETHQAVTALSSGPLCKPRDSLTRNLTTVLIKRLLKDGVHGKERQRIVAALRAISTLHPVQYNTTLEDKLTAILRTLEDGELVRVTQFIERIPDCWQYIDEAVRQRVSNFVAELPSAALHDMDFLLTFEPLRSAAEKRVQFASCDELLPLLFFGLPPKIADRIISLYLKSQSFDQANEMSKLLAMYATDLTSDHIRTIVLGIQKNDQIMNSLELAALLRELRSRKKIPEAEFDALLKANGLAKHTPAAPQT